MEQYDNTDNTEGYTEADLEALNAELTARLEGIEPHTDEWHRIIKHHGDEIAGR